MSSEDQTKLEGWDAESMRRLFDSSDELIRSVLSHLARPENVGGVAQRDVATSLELQRYLPKVMRDLKRRSRKEFGRASPIVERENGEGERTEKTLVMSEDVARLVRDVEDGSSTPATDPAPATRVEEPTVAPRNGQVSGSVHVYEPGRRGSADPVRYLRDLWSHRKLMYTLARSKIKAQSTNTIFGQAWVLLEPLFFAGVYLLLIGILRGGDLSGGRFQHLLFGLFLFSFTRIAMQQGAGSVRGDLNLLMNSSFPRLLLPSLAVMQAFLQLIPSVLLYAAVHVLTGRPTTIALVAFPGLLALQFLFSLGLALFFSAAAVYFPDLQQLLRYVTRLWMYTTPVLWRVGDFRGNLESMLEVLKWNPLFHLFSGYHEILDGRWPTSWQVLVSSLWAGGVLVVGFLTFTSRERELATRL